MDGEVMGNTHLTLEMDIYIEVLKVQRSERGRKGS